VPARPSKAVEIKKVVSDSEARKRIEELEAECKRVSQEAQINAEGLAQASVEQGSFPLAPLLVETEN
jgi:ribonuclease D